MKNFRVSLALVLVASLAILAGCSENDKPLSGVVIKKIEITGNSGYQEVALTSLADALISKGAKIDTGAKEGEEIIGTAYIGPKAMAQIVSLNVHSKSGKFVAYQTTNGAVLGNTTDMLITIVSVRVAESFGRQNENKSRTSPPAPPVDSGKATL